MATSATKVSDALKVLLSRPVRRNGIFLLAWTGLCYIVFWITFAGQSTFMDHHPQVTTRSTSKHPVVSKSFINYDCIFFGFLTPFSLHRQYTPSFATTNSALHCSANPRPIYSPTFLYWVETNSFPDLSRLLLPSNPPQCHPTWQLRCHLPPGGVAWAWLLSPPLSHHK